MTMLALLGIGGGATVLTGLFAKPRESKKLVFIGLCVVLGVQSLHALSALRNLDAMPMFTGHIMSAAEADFLSQCMLIALFAGLMLGTRKA